IKNTKIARYTLPETGGTGTKALYFAGMAMIAISISTLMIRRAKKSK
ncbi:MAG: LPXTG cell wall anchor domain-containing protein, partial [[Eubacterium] sulci]|nr:LPXTG cell wall anchor domain-containing protein [[Eubacterium] sulci]